MESYPKTVKLKDRRTVVLRPLARSDFDQLLAFFRALPEEDLLFLRHDVQDPELLRWWIEELHLAHAVPIVAFDGDELVAGGSLQLITPSWMQHVGQMRLITARTYRNKGLGGLIAHELVGLAAERNLEQLQGYVIEDNLGAIRMCEAVGFEKVAVLPGMVKDRSGKKHNLVIMVNEVSKLSRIMENWIQDSMIPAYRVPGAGGA
jgi:RimJ/RimL family protein N-acetyltransferase